MKHIFKIRFIALTLLSCLTFASAYAGDGDNKLTVSAGFLFPSTLNASIGYEKQLSWGNSIEIYGEMGDHYDTSCCHKFWDNYYWDGGVVYKPRLKKFKNSQLNFRVGGLMGSTNKDFFLGIDAGFEYSYIFPSGIEFSVIQKNNVCFLHGDTFKNGLLIGLKFPL